MSGEVEEERTEDKMWLNDFQPALLSVQEHVYAIVCKYFDLLLKKNMYLLITDSSLLGVLENF